MKKYFFIFLVLVLSFNQAYAVESQEGIETNGGDGVCAEFLTLFDYMVMELRDALLTTEEVKIMKVMIEKRKIVELSSEPELSINGIPKDAINYPTLAKPKIVISQKSWARLTRLQKKQLVFHEMLPVAGFADKDYAVSSILVSKTGDGVRNNIEILQAFGSCNAVVLRSLKKHELLPLSFMNIPSDMSYRLCLPGLEAAILAGWDVNRCNSNGETLLVEMTNKKKCEEAKRARDPVEYDELMAGDMTISAVPDARIIEGFNLFKNRVLAAGGTNVCSGHYSPTWSTVETCHAGDQ